MTGNNEFLKEFNRTRILDYVRTCGPVSRKRLSELTGLSPTAVGQTVSVLMEKGYIHETGSGGSSGGRPPVLLELKPGSYFSIGLDIDTGRIFTVVTDICGNTVCEHFFACNTENDAPGVIAQAEKMVEGVLQECRIETERLLGIGISVPGLIKPETQKVILAPNLKWKDVSTRKWFDAFEGIPVFVENEAMASAICEHWLGKAMHRENFICINIASGIGAGIFTGGRPYRGKSGTAGEVGHITVDNNGPVCGCGNRGCLETLASTGWMTQRAGKALGLAKEGMTLDNLVEYAQNGDRTAESVLFESAEYMAYAISILVNIFNPEMIILGKDFVKYSHIVMGYIRESVENRALKAPASAVSIAASSIGARSPALGASIIPLKAIFGKH